MQLLVLHHQVSVRMLQGASSFHSNNILWRRQNQHAQPIKLSRHLGETSARPPRIIILSNLTRTCLVVKTWTLVLICCFVLQYLMESLWRFPRFRTMWSIRCCLGDESAKSPQIRLHSTLNETLVVIDSNALVSSSSFSLLHSMNYLSIFRGPRPY